MRILFCAAAVIVGNILYGQNSFPTTGNVGIGTTTPTTSLTISPGDYEPKISLWDNAGAEFFGMGASWSQLNYHVGADPGNCHVFFAGGRNGDGTELMRIKGNGNVGIGIGDPMYKLTINAKGDGDGIQLISDGDNEAYSELNFQVKTTTNIPTGKPEGWYFSSRKDGYFSTDNTGNTFEIYAARKGGGYYAPLLLTSNGDIVLAGANGYHATNGNVGIGTATPNEKLAVNGKIRAKEIKVENANWPDYVFKENYKLKPLSQIEAYIKQHQHLEDVPPAATVEKEGVELGANQAVLLKKIEELTLHIIAQEKRMSIQDEKIKVLQNLIKKKDSRSEAKTPMQRSGYRGGVDLAFD